MVICQPHFLTRARSRKKYNREQRLIAMRWRCKDERKVYNYKALAMSYAANMSASGPAFGKLWFGTGSSAVRSEFANKRGNDNKAYFTTMSGFHNSSLVATSVNKVKVMTSNGNIASGTFTLYGLSNS